MLHDPRKGHQLTVLVTKDALVAFPQHLGDLSAHVSNMEALQGVGNLGNLGTSLLKI